MRPDSYRPRPVPPPPRPATAPPCQNSSPAYGIHHPERPKNELAALQRQGCGRIVRQGPNGRADAVMLCYPIEVHTLI
jgi:hypothetical protein